MSGDRRGKNGGRCLVEAVSRVTSMDLFLERLSVCHAQQP
jgi:hypothetical protein